MGSIRHTGTVTCGKTYHQGGDLGNKLAEAVNFAPPTWSVEGYKECKRGRGGCPGFPIPNEYLRFRRPGERQLRQGEQCLRDAHASNTMRLHGNKATAAKMSTKRRDLTALEKRMTARGPPPNTAERMAARGPPPNTSKRMAARSPPPNMSKRPKLSALKPDLSQMERYLKRIDRKCVIPLIPLQHNRVGPSVPSVLKLVSALLSTPAIMAFCDLVRARRSAETPLHYWVADDSAAHQIEQRLINLRNLQDKSAFGKFCVHVEEFELARAMECKRKGRIRNDSRDIEDTLKGCGWDYQTFKRHESRGRKWLRLCRPYPGILCFLLINSANVFGVSRADYLDLSDTDLSLFHALLDNEHTKTINAIGEKFLDSLSPIANDVEFRWEGQTVPWHKLSMPQALEKLAPVPWEMKNVYAPEDYPNWSRPTDWPDDWDWPMDPTSLLASDHPKCELCLQSQCDCVHARFARLDRPQPRIKDFGEKGRGIQAIASCPGQIAYVCGEYIGVVWGKIAPIGAHSGTMVMNFVRPDILYEPAVCELYCEDTGSYLRLINHSCRPSARVITMKVSGKYTLVVVAARDIYDREEITANFGKASLAGPCLCGCAARTESVG